VAADEASDFALLTAAARRSITDLRRVLQRVPRPVGERGSHFLAVIEATLTALDAAISDREKEFKTAVDDADKRAVVVATRQINSYIMSFHGVTPDIESAAEPTLGLGFIYFVDQLVAHLLKQKADVVMLPGLRYNYTTGFRPFEDLLINDLGMAKYPVSVPPIIVRYPIQEADSLFLHLIVAHELGHHVIDQAQLDQDVLKRDPDSAANAVTFDQAVGEYQKIHKVSAVRARSEIGGRLIDWLRELICDAIALGIIGPSYLLTFAAFSTPLAGPEPGPSHPPVMIRTKLLINLIDTWDWRTTLEAQIPKTFSWMEKGSKRAQEAGTKTYYHRLEEIADRLTETIRQVVEGKLGGERYTRRAYEEQSDELMTLLENNVLPAQLGDRSPSEHRAMILAGWFSAFSRHKDEPAALVKVVGDSGYQSFLTKALEMSALLETWQALP